MRLAIRRTEQQTVGRLIALPSNWGRIGDLPWRRLAGEAIPFVLLIASVVAWAVSLPSFNLAAMNDLGLISILPPGFIVAIILLTCGFCLALRETPKRGPLLLLHVGVLILILYGTPALIESTPRIAVTWRHLGLVDYVMHHGKVLPRFDAYFNWPGFFVLGAFVTQVAGLPSLVSLAAWSEVFFNALYLAPLAIIYRSSTRDTRVVWLCLWFFYLTNWVGQDYFSPQGFDYFLYVALLAVLLGWFRSESGDPFAIGAMRNWLQRAVPWLLQLIEGHRDDQPKRLISPWQRLGLMGAAIGIYAAMVPSHQLTPFAALLSVGMLVVFNQITPRSLPILMTVMVLAWTSFMAVPYFAGHLGALVGTVGSVDRNVQRGVVDRLRGSPDHVLVVHARVVITAVVAALALGGLFRRLIAGYRDVSMALLVVAPSFLILAQYGGEMFLRVFFYALPGLAFFAAALFYPSLTTSPTLYRPKLRSTHRGASELPPVRLFSRVSIPPRKASKSSWITSVALMLVSLALVGGFFLTRYGNERMDYFTPQEVQAVRYLYSVAPPGSLFVAPGISEPWQFEGYTTFRTRWLSNRVVRDAEVDTIEQEMLKYPSGGYVLITRSAVATLELYAGVSAETLSEFEQALHDSGRFTLIYQTPDARIYKFNSHAPSGGPQ